MPYPYPRRLPDGVLIGYLHPALRARWQIHSMIPENHQTPPGGLRCIIIEQHTEIRVIPLRFQSAGPCRLREEDLKGIFPVEWR